MGGLGMTHEPQEYTEITVTPGHMNEGEMIYMNVSLSSDKKDYRKSYSFDLSMGDKSIIKSGIEAMMEIYTKEMCKFVDTLDVTGPKEELRKFMYNEKNNDKNKPIDISKMNIYEGMKLIDEVLEDEK